MWDLNTIVYPLWLLHCMASLIFLKQWFNLLLLLLELPFHPNPDHILTLPFCQAITCLSMYILGSLGLGCSSLTHLPYQLDLVPGSTVLYKHLFPNPSTVPLWATDLHWREAGCSLGSLCIHALFFGHATCRILVPWPWMEPVPPTAEAQSLNHWTTREVPTDAF